MFLLKDSIDIVMQYEFYVNAFVSPHLTALREGQSTLSQAAQPLGECAASSEPLTSLYRPMMAVTLLRGTSIFDSESEMPWSRTLSRG